MGKCIQCGQCCEYLHYVDENTASVREWVLVRKGEIIQESRTHLEYRIPYRCPSLSPTTWGNEENKYVCNLQEKKPHSCAVFPTPALKKNLKKYGLSFEKSVGSQCGYVREEE